MVKFHLNWATWRGNAKVACILLTLFLWLLYASLHNFDKKPAAPTSGFFSSTPVTVVVVLCGRQVAVADGSPSQNLRELKVMIKSLLLTEYQYLRELGLENVGIQTLEIIVYTDDLATSDYITDFWRNRSEIALEYVRLAGFKIEAAVYPRRYAHWKDILFACATFRLLLGEVLTLQDAVLYLDTDVIFRKPARLIYEEVNAFTRTQWCGMAPAMYHIHGRGGIPYYGAQGLSSGIGVYNLTRMRISAILREVPGILTRYKTLPFGDQDILNVYFRSRPDEVRLLDCGANFIQYYCFPNPICSGPVQNGIMAIQGCSSTFFPPQGRTSQFSIIFDEYERLKLSAVVSVEQLREFNVNLKNRLEENQNMVKSDPTEITDETCCSKHLHFIYSFFQGFI